MRRLRLRVVIKILAETIFFLFVAVTTLFQSDHTLRLCVGRGLILLSEEKIKENEELKKVMIFFSILYSINIEYILGCNVASVIYRKRISKDVW